MFYLIPISILAYNHRASIGYYLIRTFSYMEIIYNRWYNMCYLHPDYKLFINGKQIIDKNEIQSNNSSENVNELIYEIEYTYKNKMYPYYIYLVLKVVPGTKFWSEIFLGLGYLDRYKYPTKKKFF